MSPWGLESSQAAKCQPDSRERPAALIKLLNRREGGRDRHRQPQTGKRRSVRAELLCSELTHGERWTFEKKPRKKASVISTFLDAKNLDKNVMDYYSL